MRQLGTSLQNRGYSVFVAFGSGDGAPMLEEVSIPFVHWDCLFHENRSMKNFFRAVLAIILLHRKAPYDIIHAHHRYAAAAARCAAWLFRVPLIMTIHGTVKNTGILPAYIGDQFIAVSESVKSFAVSQDPSIARQIETIPNGISLATASVTSKTKISSRQQWAISDNAVVISMIGRIVEHKGHKILLEAIQQIKTEKQIVLVIVGEGKAEERIRSYASKAGIRTIFVPVVRNSDPFFELSDIIAIPSLANEGLPITLLEAGKHSKAVIVSDIAGMHDIILDGDNGLLTKPGDVQAIAFALRKLIDDIPLREKLGNALHALVTKEYSEHRMTESVVFLYKRLWDKTNNAS